MAYESIQGADIQLNESVIAARRAEEPEVTRVTFGVNALYALSRESVRFPVSRTESIDTGQVCVTIDPDADAGTNIGSVDYDAMMLNVRYGVQAVFPGLYQLIQEGEHDPSLLNPVRAVATDRCTLNEDLRGFHAEGCLDFLPGSLWAGADGG